MSEILVKSPPNALTVSYVMPGSAAERAGIQVGDLLAEMNGHRMLDVPDYQFHATDERLRCLILRNGEENRILIRKRDGEDTGLMFASELGDKIHTCNNKCVFCFIHQMPKKMRKTLYLMDDDFRLSFMHGNYVTLTNLTEAEFQRIIDQRLSPLYVSVHATDPEVRGKLLGRKFPTPILPQIRTLADNRIGVHAQIVLCPTLNDGDALAQTLEELACEHAMTTGKRSGVESVAIVPVGLTKFRERLPKLTTANRDYAREMIAFIRQREAEFKRRLGTRFAWLSDEWYFLADLPVPGMAHYENFPQLEDGIGTVRLFLDSARRVDSRLPKSASQRTRATLVTAELPGPMVQTFADRLNEIENVEVNVLTVKNHFFGGGINIAGLITSTDLLEQLQGFPAHETLIIPEICLRERSVFLDDLSVADVAERTGLEVRVSGTKPRDLAATLGLMRPVRETRPWITGAWRMEE